MDKNEVVSMLLPLSTSNFSYSHTNTHTHTHTLTCRPPGCKTPPGWRPRRARACCRPAAGEGPCTAPTRKGPGCPRGSRSGSTGTRSASRGTCPRRRGPRRASRGRTCTWIERRVYDIIDDPELGTTFGIFELLN